MNREENDRDRSAPEDDSNTRTDAPTPEVTEHTPDSSGPTIVGIGASAGGLKALRTFFERIPEDSKLAFVVVVHLSPEHESHLAELLQPHVRMPVQQVTETTPLQPNAVYVIPPGRNLSTIDTHLRLTDLEERRRERAPIDHFFRTLARTHDGHAVGVVLTGTGSDGTLGLKEIKEKGGLTVVQDPAEAEYDGMPQSAVATGIIDLVLPLAEIPAAIQRFAGVQPRVPVPTDEDDLGHEERQILQKVFAQIRARTGRDFSRYKRSTILRRIRRRMQLRYVEEFSNYLALLRKEPHEVHALADDLLITVTNFFRDPEVFEALEKEIVPQLFERKGADDDLRVWTVGCATGEEAYSLAILLLEEAARREAEHKPVPRFQVFASDLHEKSLAKARDGFYPGDIATDVSLERLERFFHKENGGYRIRKEVRELVVFAPHNLLGDPPFSRLDLIACRNVMIYLQRAVQQDVIELFHYALRPDGILILGTSETVDGSDFFQAEDKRRCVWRKRNVPAPEPRLPVFPLLRPRLPGEREGHEHDGEPIAYGLLHQRMVERYAPPSLLVSPDDKVVHLSEHAGRYLVHPSGEPTTSAFKLVREELRIELRSILHGVREQKKPKTSKPLVVRFDEQERPVVLHARPALEPEQDGFILVIFDEREPAAEKPSPGTLSRDEAQAELNEVEAELHVSRQRLQGIIEEYETSQEELRASNEELQSANEELRSTLEELETSKEELQSMNEELQTVNQENRHKVEELAQLSSDLQNLLAATDIATLFLDREFHILRFTPRVSELFNVRTADRGRPLSDLTHRLGYDELQSDAQRVLEQLVPVEREVRDEAGRWYLTRLLPYRSAIDRIEGVVITFVDITTRKEAELALRESEEQFRALVDASASMVWTTDAQGFVVEDSPSWRAFTGQSLEEWKGRGWLDAVHPDDREQAEADWRRATETATPFFSEFCVYHAPTGTYRLTSVRAVPLTDPDGSIRGWVGMNIDEAQRKEAEEALRRSEERYRLLVENATEYAILMMDTDGRIESWSRGAERIFGYREDEVLGEPATLMFTKADREAGVPEREMETAFRTGQASDDRWHVRKSGDWFWANGVLTALRDEDGALRGFAKVLRDNTERKEAEDELRWLNETLEARVRERTEQVRELASTLAMAEQDERRRIAQILHDDLQQLLFGIQLKMTFVRRDAEEAGVPGLIEHAAESETFLDRAIQVSRQLTVDLSPPVLAGEGLVQTLEWLTTQMEEVHRLTVDLLAEHDFIIPQEGMRVLLFQIVRELLFNVVKHADTDRATVTLDEADEGLIITVTDEGAGFDPAALKPKTEGGFGLFSVRERLRLFGGTLEIESTPGQGTRMTATIPAILAPPTEE